MYPNIWMLGYTEKLLKFNNCAFLENILKKKIKL